MNFLYEKALALDYNNKRKNPWKPLKVFLNDIKSKFNIFNGIIVDLGCANGRNFSLFKSNYLIGVDNSIEFLKIALKNNNERKNKVQLILADMTKLPFRSNSINTFISIAAIHHIKNSKSRKMVMRELYEQLISQGNLLITVWRKYQKKYCSFFIIDFFKRLFSTKFQQQQALKGLTEHGDIIIPWKVSKTGRSFKRFYHLYSKSELKKDLKNFKILRLIKTGGPNKKDNFFVLLKKI